MAHIIVLCLYVYENNAYKDDPDAEPLIPIQGLAQKDPCQKKGDSAK
jgi:hypothetical protein